jgi:phospholipid/cholesterol/gamma-HCH transport system substrate-binding protein
VRRRSRISSFGAGVIGIVVLVLFAYLGFTKFANPFASSFTVHAIFSNANQLRPGSLVRIAGVNVGKVQSVSPVSGCTSAGGGASGCSAADVTMTVDQAGLPLHRDATFAIRPRIFLEGNFFVDVHPGSPEAPTVDSGFTYPIQQGIEPVQLDQVLTSLQSDTRHNLQILLQQYGIAVDQGGSAYNASIHYWLPAYKYSSIVAHDALGLQPNDLSNAIYETGDVASALDANPQALQSLITDFNTTAAAFARQNVALRQAVANLPRTLAAAIPAFNALNSSFLPLRKLARTLVPGVQSAGPAIDVSLPFIAQLRQLVAPAELRGLTADLAVAIPALAQLAQSTIPLMKNGVRPASSCVANVIYPWSQLTLLDPHFNASNGFPPRKVYVEAVDFLPGLAGESRNFDANGPYIKILGALGNSATTSLSPGLVGGEMVPIAGEQPTLPPGDARPPLQPGVPCETQPAINDLSSPSAAPPPSLTSVSLFSRPSQGAANRRAGSASANRRVGSVSANRRAGSAKPASHRQASSAKAAGRGQQS